MTRKIDARIVVKHEMDLIHREISKLADRLIELGLIIPGYTNYKFQPHKLISSLINRLPVCEETKFALERVYKLRKRLLLLPLKAKVYKKEAKR